MTEQAKQAAALITNKNRGFIPTVGIILGSGLGVLADQIQDAQTYKYDDLPGFLGDHVEGHKGNLITGYLNNVPVACLQGRAHFFQGVDSNVMKTMIRTLKVLGCKTLIVTNASGSMNKEVGPGSLVLLKDHINLQFNNPLVGPNEDDFGPRFVGLENLYHPALRADMLRTANNLNIPLTEGVYVGVLGPTFETPSEIKAYRHLGGDVVGMSTIPDVLIAHHCGMHVVAIATVTNYAAGMADQVLSHDITLEGAKLGREKLVKLIHAFLPTCLVDNMKKDHDKHEQE